jgi:hypothetical protein
MRSRFSWQRHLWIATGLSLLLALAASSQSPVEREVVANRMHLAGYQSKSGLACQRSSLCIVLWSSDIFSASDQFLGVRLGATTLSATGGVLEERIYADEFYSITPLVEAIDQRFAVFWDTTITVGPVPIKPVYRWFGRDLLPQGEFIDVPQPPVGLGGARSVAAVPTGFVQLWAGRDSDASEGAFLSFFDAAGQELRPVVRVPADFAGEQSAIDGAMTVDLSAGIITVAYSQFFRNNEPANIDVFYRRFSLAGEPLTPDVRMNVYTPDSQFSPAVTRSTSGGFVATWVSEEQDGSRAGIFGRRYAGNGSPLGFEFQLNQLTLSDQAAPKVASDASGNFVVVWKSYNPSSFGVFAWDIKARLFRTDGRPVGPEIFVNETLELEQEHPLVAFTPNGTFVVTWSSNGQVPPTLTNGVDVVARRFSASRADEPCIVTEGRFRCDTGRTGGEPEVDHPFGGAGSGLGFLGDVDRDGREDPCVYKDGAFRCDCDHEGGKAEVVIRFSAAGATQALLGDMDGDGDADPCLAGVRSFSCDLRHDGGAPELKLRFGQSGETLLLGDLNGDHRAEACAFFGGIFRCDTAHNGGKAELMIRFGRRGDQALLGDFDGDGRDDPCVFRQGMLLCDTAHDGGAAEGMLSLGRQGDVVALGNLDGL